jgi:hypothetical protein
MPPGAASAPAPANVRERSQQIQKQVADDINKAMEQARENMPDDAK